MTQGFYDNKDSMDINELASLNDDISDDLLEHLQNQLSKNISDQATQDNKTDVQTDVSDDSVLFEEPQADIKDDESQQTDANAMSVAEEINDDVSPEAVSKENIEETAQPIKDASKNSVEVNQDFDDNFIKKYKAKLKNRAKDSIPKNTPVSYGGVEPADENSIETLSNGNISEKPLTQDLKDYNDSLDFLDGNVKYSKYVIYIDPENVDFIESLTVKERKNLINGILRQQEDIAITKQRFKVIQAVIRHSIVAILTVTLSIPIIYYAINTSLEITINNHRNALSNWQVLYRENGKITKN